MSDDGAPITSNGLKRINVERLARAAARYDTDEAARRGREMAEAVAAAQRGRDPAQLVAEGLAWWEEQGDEGVAIADELRRVAAQVGPDAILASGLAGVEAQRFTRFNVEEMARRAGVNRPPKRKGGRPPKWSREFLTRVTAWALEAREDGKAIYPYVADRASKATGADYDEDNAKWWIKRAKQLGLLAPDELGRPPKTKRTNNNTRGDR
jgi:hypothetical protein